MYEISNINKKWCCHKLRNAERFNKFNFPIKSLRSKTVNGISEFKNFQRSFARGHKNLLLNGVKLMLPKTCWNKLEYGCEKIFRVLRTNLECITIATVERTSDWQWPKVLKIHMNVHRPTLETTFDDLITKIQTINKNTSATRIRVHQVFWLKP